MCFLRPVFDVGQSYVLLAENICGKKLEISKEIIPRQKKKDLRIMGSYEGGILEKKKMMKVLTRVVFYLELLKRSERMSALWFATMGKTEDVEGRNQTVTEKVLQVPV